jgi:hypothetical protein
MAIQKPPAGTRGSRTPPRVVARLVMPMMTRIHRLTHDRFNAGFSGDEDKTDRTIPVPRLTPVD